VFWDLFTLLAEGGGPILVDAGAYPIARWGIERAMARGAPVRPFAHHDPAALRRALRQAAPGAAPVVVVDGFCPGCGRPAPLRGYLAALRPLRGLLVVDDTQALGILGRAPGPAAPYGVGGGGTLAQGGVGGADVILVGSLAKGLGAPVAVLAGAAPLVAAFEARSATRVHCSPPSVAVVRAAERALAVNAALGDRLRARLAARVRRFRDGLAALGLRAAGGLFPVQVLAPAPGPPAPAIHARLRAAGVRALLVRRRAGRPPRLAFLLTAAHAPEDVDRALDALRRAVGGARRPRRDDAAPTPRSA
jgi:8-amino-7-oxononanoate synthase